MLIIQVQTQSGVEGSFFFSLPNALMTETHASYEEILTGYSMETHTHRAQCCKTGASDDSKGSELDLKKR